MKIFRFSLIALVGLFCLPVYSYLGPGMGGGLFAAVIGIFIAIFAALFGIIYFPIKRFFSKFKKNK